jgi:hypothetical protein
MKTKTSSKKIALLACALLALNISAPTVVEAVPITLSLDNPNQTVARPSSGTTIVDFAGTVIVDPNFRFDLIDFDVPFNASGDSLNPGDWEPAFLTFFNSPDGGTYTGSIFHVTVSATNPPGLYQFNVVPQFPSELFLRVIPLEGGETVSARETISVLVTGVGVPDRGSSILLLGLSLAALWSLHALKRVAV